MPAAVALFHVIVRRDAHTMTPVTVPEYEVAVLQTIFGEENVQTVRREPITGRELTEDDIVGEFQPGDSEFDRLAMKYSGNDEGLFVEQVFGKKATKGLEKAIAAAAKPRKKPAGAKGGGKAAAAPDGETGAGETSAQ